MPETSLTPPCPREKKGCLGDATGKGSRHEPSWNCTVPRKTVGIRSGRVAARLVWNVDVCVRVHQDMMVFPGVAAAALAMQDSDSSSLFGSSDDSCGKPDGELRMPGYCSCAQCKGVNNNPLFRFCGNCYKGRKGFYPPRPFPVKTRDELRKRRRERRRARTKPKKPATPDISSGEEEVNVTKKQKLVCIKGTDSGISCSSQETLSQNVVISAHSASVMDRLVSGAAVVNLVMCGGVDVVDGKGNDGMGDETVGKDYSSRLRDAAGKDSVGVAAGGSETPDALPEEKLAADKVVCGVKRPIAESCSALPSTGVVDEGLAGTGRNIEQPSLVGRASCSCKHLSPAMVDGVVAAEKCSVCLRGSDVTRACGICYSQPKNATFIHGCTGHTISCYSCAMHIWKMKKFCPVCKQKIQAVIKNYIFG